IQHIFSIVNNILSKNSFCNSNSLSLNTYKVIPMGLSLGAIQWVENTKPLLLCMKESLAKISPKNDPMLSAISEKNKFVSKYKDWNSVLMKPSKSDSFLFIRSEFIKSLATINIAHYLLGIGDRHLDNFLLELNSGKLVGIDFGHAFGSATQVLGVPELVPFRLTNQIENYLAPLGSNVLLRPIMINVLQGNSLFILSSSY
ncbi:kinase-like protein, partial [Rozella allomycis CSF55]